MQVERSQMSFKVCFFTVVQKQKVLLISKTSSRTRLNSQTPVYRNTLMLILSVTVKQIISVLWTLTGSFHGN